MYTRSRSTGGPNFGNGRNPMNQENGNFQSQHPYNNQQGGNFPPSAYKPGIIEPSAPFKPSEPQTPQQHQQKNEGQQQNTPRLKPILKQAILNPGQGNAAPSPVPAPNPSAASPGVIGTGANKNQGQQQQKQQPKTGESQPDLNVSASSVEDDPRWTEDDLGRWGDQDDQTGWMDTEDGSQEQPKWRRFKKNPGNKPNKKLKRLRMNQRLRKALMPKNAIMVLNEMKAGVQFTFPETQSSMPNSLFLVHAELEGKVYVGQGLSKPLARQNAAENALKCLLLEKMTAAAMKDRAETSEAAAKETAMETSPATDGTPGSEAATKDENGEEIIDDKDDVPWSSLASFALYKLFLEWQNQGTVVPIPRTGVPAMPKARVEPKPSPDKQLPPNATEIHPVMLLNQMKPGTTYAEVGRVGTPPNIQFTLGVEINGATYTGTAKNKKDAKKMAAKEALKALYNLEFPEEIKIDVANASQ